MADIVITPANVDAAFNAVIERITLGEAADAGDILYLDGSNGWKKADANALESAQAHCVLYGSGVVGTSFPSGAQVDAVFYGRMAWGSGMTPDGRVYVSATAGKGDQTATTVLGEFPFVIGWAFAADELFVDPQTAVPTAN